MKPYIHDARNGIYILDLTKTMLLLENSCKFLFDVVFNGGTILLVGTKRQAQEIIRTAAESTGMPYVSERWLGGTLTNNKTIRKSVAHMERIRTLEATGELDKLSKKEASSIRRQLAKLEKNLSGISKMNGLPKALIVVDVQNEEIAVNEARRLGIPLIGLIDTNSNPDPIDYLIPGNDDAQRSIKIIIDILASVIQTAKDYRLKVQAETASKENAEEASINDDEISDSVSESEVTNDDSTDVDGKEATELATLADE